MAGGKVNPVMSVPVPMRRRLSTKIDKLNGRYKIEMNTLYKTFSEVRMSHM